jgi:hypothetical protein
MSLITILNFSVSGDCENLNQGSVYFDITGTTPNFGVTDGLGLGLIPTSANTTSYSVSGLSGGTYWALVTDAGLTETLVPIYISTGTSVSVTSTPTTCGGDNGTLTAFTDGIYGTATFYLYSGDNELISSAVTPNNFYEFTSLYDGTYYVIADDGGGCSGISESAIIIQSEEFDFGGYVVDDSSCTGFGSGKIFLTGLTQPINDYTITWSNNVNGQTGPNVTGLTSGVYVVTVKDNKDCEATKTFNVVSVPPITSQGFITLEQPSCFNNDGSVEFIIAGGTPPYFFSGSTGQVEITFNQSVTFTGLSSGNYSFLCTDAGLCSVTDSVSLLTPNSFTTVFANTTNSFCSQDSGSIQIVVDNGVSSINNLLISLSGSTGIQQYGILGNPIQTFNGLPNGDYVYTVESEGCTYTGFTTINSQSLYEIDILTSGTTCGGNNGTLIVNVTTGGTLPYSFTLFGPDYDPTTITTPIGVFNNLREGNYTLTVIDSGTPGCQQTIPVFINGSQSVYFDLFPTQPLFGNDGEVTTFIYNGQPPFSLNWSGNGVSGQTGTTITGLSSGTYSLTVTDSLGCSLTKTVVLSGTQKVSSYRYFTICDEPFTDSGLIGKRNVRSMFLEGFNDLTSGDTNCIINNAVFYINAEVGGQSKTESFFTSSGVTDYPSDLEWAQAIQNILIGFNGISEVDVDIISNRITIKTDCEKLNKDCVDQTINPLQDTLITVNMIIDYNISCVSCD